MITFQQMIVLCDADGIIDMTPSAISKRTSIPVEHIKAGIEILEKPDPWSRTPDEEGRRIVRLDDHRPWGWYLVNHKKYKSLQDSDTVREQNRIRKQRQRDKQKESRFVTDGHAQSRHTDTDTDTNKKHNANAVASASIQEVIDFLNGKTGKAFQLKNPKGKYTANANIIRDRLKDGYSIQQCKTVIARKCREWDNDKMRHCLTPETIFRKSNFDKYIGECVADA